MTTTDTTMLDLCRDMQQTATRIAMEREHALLSFVVLAADGEHQLVPLHSPSTTALSKSIVEALRLFKQQAVAVITVMEARTTVIDAERNKVSMLSSDREIREAANSDPSAIRGEALVMTLETRTTQRAWVASLTPVVGGKRTVGAFQGAPANAMMQGEMANLFLRAEGPSDVVH